MQKVDTSKYKTTRTTNEAEDMGSGRRRRKIDEEEEEEVEEGGEVWTVGRRGCRVIDR